MRRIEPRRTVDNILRAQFGIISRRQALSAGLTARQIDLRVARGEWHKVLPGTYAVANTPADFRSELMALSLWAANAGGISHLSAAWLWQLRAPVPVKPDITVTNNRRAPSSKIRVHHSSLPSRDITSVGPIPATTVSRTLVDAAACLTSEELEIAIDDARRRGLVSWARLRWQYEQTCGPGRRGSRKLAEILSAREASDRRDSGLETRLGRTLRKTPVATPVAQYWISDRGKSLARVDFAWPPAKIAVECESYTWHSGRREWVRDTKRLNELTALGWLVLRATDEDVRNPGPLIEKLRRLLRERRHLS